MGLMGETAKATVSAGGKVIGVTTTGLSAKGRSVVTGIQELQTENLSKRKETMVSLSDAFITMPGGIGTLDEFFSVISQAKVGEIRGKSALFNTDSSDSRMVMEPYLPYALSQRSVVLLGKTKARHHQIGSVLYCTIVMLDALQRTLRTHAPLRFVYG